MAKLISIALSSSIALLLSACATYPYESKTYMDYVQKELNLHGDAIQACIKTIPTPEKPGEYTTKGTIVIQIDDEGHGTENPEIVLNPPTPPLKKCLEDTVRAVKFVPAQGRAGGGTVTYNLSFVNIRESAKRVRK